jgi:hypothetical protein
MFLTSLLPESRQGAQGCAQQSRPLSRERPCRGAPVSERGWGSPASRWASPFVAGPPARAGAFCSWCSSMRLGAATCTASHKATPLLTPELRRVLAALPAMLRGAQPGAPPTGATDGQICDADLLLLALLPTPDVAVASPSPVVTARLEQAHLEPHRVLAVRSAILCGSHDQVPLPQELRWRGKLRCSELTGSNGSEP